MRPSHCFLLLICFWPFVYGFAQPDTPPQADSQTLDWILIHQAASSQMPAFQDSFRPGKTTPLIAGDFLNLKEHGFVIQLPAQSLTPSPTIYDGTVYVSGGFGSRQFFAFDALSGSTRWALDLSDDGPSAAVVEEDVVVFNTESCTIFAHDAQNGDPLWSWYLGDPLLSTPCIANGKVFTAYPLRSHGFLPSHTGNQYQQQVQVTDMGAPSVPVAPAPSDSGTFALTHALIGFDLKSGEILWQQYLDGDIMSAPVAEGEELYLTTFPGTVYRISQTDGTILSIQKGKATSAPVLYGNQLLLTSRAAGGAVAEQIQQTSPALKHIQTGYTRKAPYLDATVQSRSTFASQAIAYDAGNGFGNGAPEGSGWQAANENIGQANVSSLQAYNGSRILPLGEWQFTTMGDELICAKAKNGKVRWKKALPGKLEEAGGHLATPPLAVSEEAILICTLEGDLLVYEAKNGKLLFQQALGHSVRSQPVVENGIIYCTSMEGQLIAVQTGHPEWTGWSCWGGNSAHTNQR